MARRAEFDERRVDGRGTGKTHQIRLPESRGGRIHGGGAGAAVVHHGVERRGR